MWFNDTKGAIIKNSSSFHKSILRFSTKKEIYFSLSGFRRICSVSCVFSTVSSKQSSERTRCFLLCFLCISWTYKVSPFFNGLWSSKTHSNNNITLHMTTKIWEKWFSNMLSIKLLNRCIIEFWHFQFIDFKSIFINCIDDFTKIGISIRFYHCVGATTVAILFIRCSNIAVLSNMQHSCINRDFCSDVKIWQF